MDDATRHAADRLATSRMVPLDEAIQCELAEIAQDLISRGLFNSSMQVTNTMSAGARNLTERAELITNTIKEVCSSRNLRPTPTLAVDLKSLFDDIYQKQLASVQGVLKKRFPNKTKSCVRSIRSSPISIDTLKNSPFSPKPSSIRSRETTSFEN